MKNIMPSHFDDLEAIGRINSTEDDQGKDKYLLARMSFDQGSDDGASSREKA